MLHIKKIVKLYTCRGVCQVQRQRHLHGAVRAAVGAEPALQPHGVGPAGAAGGGPLPPAAVPRAAALLLHQPPQPHDRPLPPAQHPAVRRSRGLLSFFFFPFFG